MKNQKYKKLYESIWNDRKIWGDNGDYIECNRCGTSIYECELNVWHFSHILSKGSSPELKYDPDNIEILCAKDHGNYHASGKFNNYLPIK